jgi:hypothetical protein
MIHQHQFTVSSFSKRTTVSSFSKRTKELFKKNNIY